MKLIIGLILSIMFGYLVLGEAESRLEIRHKPCEYFKTSSVPLADAPARCFVNK